MAILRQLKIEIVDIRDDPRTGILELHAGAPGPAGEASIELLGGLTIAWLEGFAAEAVRLDASVPLTLFVPPEWHMRIDEHDIYWLTRKDR